MNASIGRSNGSDAEQLQRILGLASDTAQAVGDSLGRAQAERNKQTAGQAAIDATAGLKQEDQYAASKVYRRAYDFENAKSGAIQLDTALTQAVQERLNNSEDPATLDDIMGLVDETYRGYALDADGKPRDFGSPEAQLAVAKQLSDTRARLVGSAVGIIKKQTDEKTLATIAGNILFDRVNAVNAVPLTGVGTVPIPPSSVAPATVVASAPSFRMAPNGYVATSELADLFGREKGVRIGGQNRSAERNRQVNGVPNSQHIGATPDVTSGIDMNGVTPARAKSILAANGLTGEIIQHNAGSGLHVHIESVKPLDPKAAGPAPVPVAGEPPLPTRSAPVDFEQFMARVPPSIDRGEAKKYLLAAMIQHADEEGDDKLMDGLWQSKRADGTPSFNPTEIGLLRDERDRIRDKNRTDADRAQRKKWDENADVLTTAIINGNPPSDATLQEWANRGDADPKFVYSLMQHNEAERKADIREATADARQAAAEDRNDNSLLWGAEAEGRRNGALRGASYEEDRARLDRGEFGQGKAAVAIFKSLRASARAGEAVALDPTRNPDIASYQQRIQDRWAPAKKGAGNSILTRLNGGGANRPDDYRPGITAEYRRLLKSGEDPAAAYLGAVAKMGPKENQTVQDARRIRIQRLSERAASGR